MGVPIGSFGGGKNYARFVFKIGLDGQLDSHLGTHTALCSDPYKDKKQAKNSDF